MATLTGRTIASSYTELLKTTSASGVTGSLDTVQDGDATDSALQISTAGVKSTGTLASTGITTLSADLRLEDDAGGEYVGIGTPSAVTSYTVTLPAAVGSSGQALRTSDSSGTLEWFTPEVGDITAVTAGTNLNGGGSSGDVTLNLDTTITGLTSVTSTAFVGGLTGDVTGNVTGNVTGDLTGNVTATSVLANGVTATTQSSGDNSTKVATTAYVDSQVTAEDLDFQGDSGTGSVDLDSQSLDVAGGTNITTAASSQTLTVNLDSTLTGLSSVTSTNFVGDITGDVTGNVSGTAATVTGATQAAITSAANLATVGTIGTGVWQGTAIDGAYVDIEGTEIKSTGESGGTKFLREDGDGTCSWQTVAGDIESVTAGTNLNGGGSSGDVTINLDTNITGDITFDTDTLVVDATNNRVGIGRTPTSNALEVDGSISVAPDSGTGAITFAGTGSAEINQYVNYALTLKTNNTAAVTIDNSQRVGIGTAAPSRLLHLSSSAGTFLRMDTGDVGADDFSIGVNTNGWSVYNETDSSYSLVVDGSGNIGLGTTAPSDFHSSGNRLVVGDGSGEQGLTVYSSSSSNGVINFADSNSGDARFVGRIYYDHSDNKMNFSVDGSTRSVITSTGLGIGTAVPSAKLDCRGNANFEGANANLTINATSSYPYINMEENGTIRYQQAYDVTNNLAYFTAAESGSEMWFGTANAERMRIGSSGQLGIGGANYGTSGQVLTSNGSGSAPSWQDASGGGGGGGDVSKVGTPASGQVGYWTGDGTLAGENDLFYDATNNRLMIGTNATTGYNLHVNSTGSAIVQISGGTNYDQELRFGDASSYLQGRILYNTQSDYMSFDTTDGTERMRINSTGLGIGTTAPAQKLHVNSNSIRFANGDNGIDFTQQNSTNWSIVPVGSTTSFAIQGGLAVGASYIATEAPSNGAIIQGNCGIGTTSPAKKFHCVGEARFDGTSGSANVYINSTAADSDAYLWFMENGSSKASVFHDASADALVLTDGAASATVYVKSDNVGIGTAAPSSKLEISGSGTLAKFTGTGTTTYLKITDATSSGGNFIGATGDTLHFWTDNIQAITVDGSQRVGLGTTAPESKLSIPTPLFSSSTTDGMIRWMNPNSTADSCIQSYYVTGQGSDVIIGSNTHINTLGNNERFNTSEESCMIGVHRDGILRFYTGGTGITPTTRMVIDSSGDVGIGTTAPSGTLHLRDTTPKIYIQSNDGNDASVVFGDASDASRGQIKYTSSDEMIFLVNNLSEKLRINSNGAWSFDGGSSFGTSGMDYLFSDGNGSTPYWSDGFGESDSRLKENVKEFKALDSINKLRPVEFDWNDKAKKEGHDFGLIAQEVEPVLPNIVRECKRTGYKKLDYEGMVPFLVQSVKELTEENKALRERLDAIEQKVQSL